jgi:hypothetical protein
LTELQQISTSSLVGLKNFTKEVVVQQARVAIRLKRLSLVLFKHNL